MTRKYGVIYTPMCHPNIPSNVLALPKRFRGRTVSEVPDITSNRGLSDQRGHSWCGQVDVQSMLDCMGAGNGGVPAITGAYHHGLCASVQGTFKVTHAHV